MEKLKIAIIGYGGMANYHIKNMKASRLFDISGVYDIDENKKKQIKKEGYKLYSDENELFNDKEITAVLIATPNEVHAPYAIKAAKAKKHILCEKPVTLNSDLLETMICEAEKNGVIFTVNQNRRWDKDYLKIKSIYDNKPFGKIYRIESRVMGSHSIPGDWRKYKKYGGGMIYDWGVHLIDQALQINKSKIVGVHCTTSYVYGFEVDDGVDLTLYFEDGMEYKIIIDTNSFINLPRWMAYGENGSAIIKDWLCRGKMVKVTDRIDIFNKGIKAGNGFTKTMADRSNKTVIKLKLPKVDIESNALYKNFIDAIKGVCKPIVNYDELKRVMRVMEVAFKAAEINQTIKTEI